MVIQVLFYYPDSDNPELLGSFQIKGKQVLFDKNFMDNISDYKEDIERITSQFEGQKLIERLAAEINRSFIKIKFMK